MRKTTEQKRQSGQAEVVLLLVAAIWGGGFVAGKLALECFTPLAVVGLRFCGSSLVLGLLFHKRIFQCKRSDAVKGCLIGCVQFCALLIQLVGLQYTSAMKQSFIAATYVVFTPFVAFLILKTKIRKNEILVAAIAMLGVGLISLNGQLDFQIGDGITLGFAVLFSLQIVLVERYAKKIDSIALTFYQFFAAGLCAVAGMLLTETSLSWPSSTASLGGILYLVLINTALAIGLQNYAQKYARASRASLILSLEAVFGFIFSALYFHENITIKMIVGCVLVFAAIIVSNQNKASGVKSDLKVTN